MASDECTPYETKGVLTTEREARLSMELSLRWAARCRDEFARLGNPNALFGIVQGGMFESLREFSLDALVAMDFPGYAIGGVSVGEPKEDMQRLVAHTPHRLPAQSPLTVGDAAAAAANARTEIIARPPYWPVSCEVSSRRRSGGSRLIMTKTPLWAGPG